MSRYFYTKVKSKTLSIGFNRVNVISKAREHWVEEEEGWEEWDKKKSEGDRGSPGRVAEVALAQTVLTYFEGGTGAGRLVRLGTASERPQHLACREVPHL